MESDISGTVFNIQKFCTDDGPGIRTTVFLKGCHLRCQWCHNPEGLDVHPTLEYNDRLCAFCHRCESVFPRGCHYFEGDTHYIDRSKCIQCGKCVQSCEYGAVKLCGKTMSAGEVMKIALADKAFYVSSGGGITISGGEPLLQSDFVLAILSLAKENGIHTCIETSGAVQFDIIKKVQPYADLFLFDIKETDEQNHIKYTGISNRLPMENIRKLDELGASVKMRCPIIPGVNDVPRHFLKLKELYSSLKHCVGIQIMPYHMLGQGKVGRFGVEGAKEFSVPTKEQIEAWNNMIKI